MVLVDRRVNEYYNRSLSKEDLYLNIMINIVKCWPIIIVWCFVFPLRVW